MTLVATPRRHCPDGSLNLDDLIDALLVEGLPALDGPPAELARTLARTLAGADDLVSRP